MKAWHDHSDSELLAGLHQGDHGAFEAIYRRYAKDLFRLATHMIPLREEGEEIVQEIFESLWKRRDEMHLVTALKPYLIGMVRYKVFAYIRGQKVKKKYLEHYQLFEAAWETLDATTRTPDNVLSVIRNSIEKLPPRCREALKLRLDEDLSNKEIALRMNVSRDTVENYMTLAVQRLRGAYGEFIRMQ